MFATLCTRRGADAIRSLGEQTSRGRYRRGGQRFLKKEFPFLFLKVPYFLLSADSAATLASFEEEKCKYYYFLFPLAFLPHRIQLCRTLEMCWKSLVQAAWKNEKTDVFLLIKKEFFSFNFLEFDDCDFYLEKTCQLRNRFRQGCKREKL